MDNWLFASIDLLQLVCLLDSGLLASQVSVITTGGLTSLRVLNIHVDSPSLSNIGKKRKRTFYHRYASLYHG